MLCKLHHLSLVPGTHTEGTTEPAPQSCLLLLTSIHTPGHAAPLPPPHHAHTHRSHEGELALRGAWYTLRYFCPKGLLRVKAREQGASHSDNAQGTSKMRNFPLQMSHRGRGICARNLQKDLKGSPGNIDRWGDRCGTRPLSHCTHEEAVTAGKQPLKMVMGEGKTIFPSVF